MEVQSEALSYEKMRGVLMDEADEVNERIAGLQSRRAEINEEIATLRMRQVELRRVVNAIKGRKKTKK